MGILGPHFHDFYFTLLHIFKNIYQPALGLWLILAQFATWYWSLDSSCISIFFLLFPFSFLSSLTSSRGFPRSRDYTSPAQSDEGGVAVQSKGANCSSVEDQSWSHRRSVKEPVGPSHTRIGLFTWKPSAEWRRSTGAPNSPYELSCTIFRVLLARLFFVAVMVIWIL